MARAATPMTVWVGGVPPHPAPTAWPMIPSFSKSGLDDVGPELDDVGEVEVVGREGDAQVAERLLHLLGEVGRDDHAVGARPVLPGDQHQLRTGRDGGGVAVAERDRIVQAFGVDDGVGHVVTFRV